MHPSSDLAGGICPGLLQSIEAADLEHIPEFDTLQVQIIIDITEIFLIGINQKLINKC